jgi:hypothetical protein
MCAGKLYDAVRLATGPKNEQAEPCWITYSMAYGQVILSCSALLAADPAKLTAANPARAQFLTTISASQ